MSIVAQIFACTAIPTTIILIIQTVMLFIGIGADADGIGDDIDADLPDELPSDYEATEPSDVAAFDGFRLFTFRTVIAFFVVFGWVGVLADNSGAPLYISLPLAFLSGFFMMFIMALIFRAFMKLRANGNSDNRNAIGVSGRVQLTIPAARSGEGKVHLMLQGAYVERNAVPDEETDIPTGSEIVVIGISGQTDLVVKRK